MKIAKEGAKVLVIIVIIIVTNDYVDLSEACSGVISLVTHWAEVPVQNN